MVKHGERLPPSCYKDIVEVCQWRNANDNEWIKHTPAEGLQELAERGIEIKHEFFVGCLEGRRFEIPGDFIGEFKFCPFCGKKIFEQK